MPVLVLINGAPGAGKSSLADLLASEDDGAVAVHVDQIKHAQDDWASDPHAAGLRARVLALEIVSAHLRAGANAYVGQFLARPAFVEALEQAAADNGADFVELLLEAPLDALGERLDRRGRTPERPDHAVNRALVSADDLPGLVHDLDEFATTRPRLVAIDAGPSIDAVARRAAAAIDARLTSSRQAVRPL